VRIEAARRAEHLERRAVVNVLALAERVDEGLLAGEVREHPQLDLRVVSRDEHVSAFGDEGAPDLAADLGPDRDVLQVGVAAAQPSCCRDGLVEARVHAPGVGVDQGGQRVDIRALQLLEAAPLEDELGQLV
jgi:hypothetical protein